MYLGIKVVDRTFLAFGSSHFKSLLNSSTLAG